jgi:hypothetical protein
MVSIAPQQVPPVNDPETFNDMAAIVDQVNANCKAAKMGYELDRMKIVGI